MKSGMLIAIALLALAGLAVPASAEEGDIVVNVPFEFVAGTQKLPAGKYTVSRASTLDFLSLRISNRDHSAFLLPGPIDDTHLGSASLSFDEIGGQRVLSEIKTPAGVYTIDNRREAQRLTKMASGRTHSDGMTSSGGGQ